MSLLIPLAKTKGPRQASVIFIHGLGGHPFDTWQARGKDESGNPPFWPVWLAEDLSGVDVYTIGYAASAVGWTGQTMAIEDRADNICELLLGENGLSEAPMFVLCHSLGGIILKSAMLRLKERAPHEADAAALYASIQKIVFLATPHTGSEKAGLMDRFRLLLWPTALTKALVSDAASLRKINNSYRILADERKSDLRHKVLFETRSTALGRIVREGAADPGLVNSSAVGIDGDHISMVKPKSRAVLMYKSVLDFLSDGMAKDDRPPPTILQRPTYDPETQVDVLGVAARIAALAAMVGLAWLYWPQPGIAEPGDGPDFVQTLYAIAAIQSISERVVVAERLLGRALSDQEIFLVESLQLPAESAARIDTAGISELARTGTEDDLRAAVSQIDISACQDGTGFEIVDNRLRCVNGDLVTFIATPNQGGPITSLEALIFHFTASSNASSTIRFLASSNARASAHILVDRSGGVVQMVPFDISAWHAGQSRYEPLGLTGLNRYSVGIQLVNLGQLKQQEDGSFKAWTGETVVAAEVEVINEGGTSTYWHKYTPEQIATATDIVRAFRASDPTILILGHSDVSPGRKTDPGPAFPLQDIDLATR